MSPEEDQRITNMEENIRILEVEIAILRLDLEAKKLPPVYEAPDVATPPTEYLEKSQKVINLETKDPFVT